VNDNLGLVSDYRDYSLYVEGPNGYDFSTAFLSARAISDSDVPEPVTLALLGLGLAGLGVSRRRQRVIPRFQTTIQADREGANCGLAVSLSAH
jgi:hypothetical protein